MVGNSVVFDSSDGGDAGLGQIWTYAPTTNIGVNIQVPDITCAITGDWASLGL